MKTTVEIADPLFDEARTIAQREGVSFRVLVEEGLREVVRQRSKAAAKPFRLRDGSFGGGKGLQPGVQWSDLTALAYEGEHGTTLR
ncbi:MAG: hypothetical protein R2729_12505 [Bryobacteraceae bacterium]